MKEDCQSCSARLPDGGQGIASATPVIYATASLAVTIQRVTLSLAGQTIAVHVTDNQGLDDVVYVVGDHLGSVSQYGDASGAALGEPILYLPFGDFRQAPSGALPSDRLFTGHRAHNIGDGPNNLGLIFMNARYYSVGTGRFISADTLVPDPTDPQSYDRFSYVGNNPLKYVDPSGHCPTTAEGDPDTSTAEGAACWIYLTNDFCDDGLCGSWWEWIIVNQGSSWTREELVATRAALLATREYGVALGFSLRGLVGRITRFEKGDCAAGVACTASYVRNGQYERSVIRIDQLTGSPERWMLNIIHELGHAVQMNLEGDLYTLRRYYLDVRASPPELLQDVIYSRYGYENPNETWPELFAATVFHHATGDHVTAIPDFRDSRVLMPTWSNPAPNTTSRQMFEALYVAVGTVLSAYSR